MTLLDDIKNLLAEVLNSDKAADSDNTSANSTSIAVFAAGILFYGVSLNRLLKEYGGKEFSNETLKGMFCDGIESAYSAFQMSISEEEKKQIKQKIEEKFADLLSQAQTTIRNTEEEVLFRIMFGDNWNKYFNDKDQCIIVLKYYEHAIDTFINSLKFMQHIANTPDLINLDVQDISNITGVVSAISEKIKNDWIQEGQVIPNHVFNSVENFLCTLSKDKPELKAALYDGNTLKGELTAQDRQVIAKRMEQFSREQSPSAVPLTAVFAVAALGIFGAAIIDYFRGE